MGSVDLYIRSGDSIGGYPQAQYSEGMFGSVSAVFIVWQLLRLF